MSPARLFDLLRGELVDIADYAVNHYKKTGRPLRLAVNASSWWYANMTAATAQALRDERGKDLNPIERNILFYTLHILLLGIQLHFVFDGPKRMSNGGKLYPGHDAPSLLFQDTLTHIEAPWHEAPGEAEAECAKMELEGIVDGVWSEDGDALAFGCQTLIKSHFEIRSSTERSEDVRKSPTHFKVYKVDDLARQNPGMNREGFILCAVLNDSPHNIGELYNLGPQDRLDAAGHDLGRSLCAAARSGKDLTQWATTNLAGYLTETGSGINVPPKFPKWEHVQDYLNPVTSTPEIFLDLPQPWVPPPDENTLFSFLVDKFQWTIKQWVKYVVPVRIVRSLLATEEGKESQHDLLKLESDPKKKSPRKTKATFLLCNATSLDVSALYELKGVLETLPWILRKANFNRQPSITSFFLTPKSVQEGKGKGKGKSSASAPRESFRRSEHGADSELPSSSASAPRVPFRRLEHGADMEIPTPSSSSAFSSNGESSSQTIDRSQRQNTPPTPTPGRKKRTLPWATDERASKNIRRARKNDHRAKT